MLEEDSTPKLSRRQLGLAALAGAASSSLSADESAPYVSPLDQATSKVGSNTLDPVAWTRQRYESAPLRMTFRAQTRKQAESWQKQLRAKVVELVGGFPAATTPLQPQTVEVREFPGYRRELFTFISRPGLAVAGYLLTPKTGRGPWPAVICVPGHGRGVDDIVGIDAKGRDRTEKEGYEYDYAVQVVEHGMAAVALGPIAFGCRRDANTKKKGLTTSACQPSAGAALLLGETMIGWRAYDVMRTVDWIATRSELDAKRVGCMGISGGGTCTLFSTAMEPRIQAAFVSGYLNTFRDSILSLSHCIDNYVPGILNWAEMYDVAGLIAPRPLCFESGRQDPIFPIAAAQASFARVQKVYTVFDAAAQTQHEVFEGRHEFHGKQGLPFLARSLRA